MPDIVSLQVTALQPDPVEPSGGTATVTAQSGDIVYYADTPQVSPTNNQGSLTVGNSATFTGSTVIWLRSASLSQVQVQLSPAAPAQIPASVISASSQALGTVGASSSVTLTNNQRLSVTLTLSADHVCTITPTANAVTRFYITQDGVGGRTFAISDGSATQTIGINTGPAAQSVVVVSCSPDGTTLYVETS